MSARRMRIGVTIMSVLVGVVLTSACKQKPELTCRVNAVCFVCPDEKSQAACQRDPSSARCKYAEPSHCNK